MKFVIAFSCLLAVASAGYLGNVVPYTTGYTTAYTSPIAYATPKSFGYTSSSVHPYGYYSGALSHGYGYGYAGLATEARQVDPVAIAAGAPLPTGDTVEVAAAKAQHFQAHAAAKGLSYATPVVSTYSHLATPYVKNYVTPYVNAYAGLATEARLVDPVAIAAGAPLPTGDTVEVAAAKAKHFEAHAAAKGIHYSTPLIKSYAHGYAGLATEARLVDPVAIAAGAPLPTGDTVEVAAAKAAHFQAHAAAKGLRFKRSPQYLSAYSYPSTYGYSTYGSPLAYSGYTGYGYGYGYYG